MSFLTTLAVRPYVFVFLAAFLFLSIRKWGLRRSLIWLISGYFIAWLSEYSSIHNGFPYGEYHYVYENLKGELLVLGVPFFDSLSYTFLTFAGYTMTGFLLTVSRRHCEEAALPAVQVQAGQLEGRRGNPVESRWCAGDKPRLVVTILLGAFLTMLLDVIVDPVATMGDKWFLGKIHFYTHPGWYFGVPMSNFAGWFLVSFVIIAFNIFLKKFFTPYAVRRTPYGILYPAFYIGIALFSTTIAFYIEEWRLGLVNLAILTIISTLVFLKLRLHQKKAPWVFRP